MATPPSYSTPVLFMPTSSSSSKASSTKESLPVPDPPGLSLRESRRKGQQRRRQLRRERAANLNQQWRVASAESPPAARLRGSLGSVEERKAAHLMLPLPVGTGADISTLEDDSEGFFVPPLQPEEESGFIMADTEEVWETWIANHVLAWRDPYWPIPVYVREDSSGYFHTYPSLGGPFRRLDEVGSAVVSQALDIVNDMSARLSGLSPRERLVDKYLYWPDGTNRLCTRLEKAKMEDKKLRRLVEALLDKYNDNQDDNEDCVGELEDIVHWQSISEGFDKWYYHLNIRLKTKVAADDAGSANLFFVEVARDQMRHTLGYYIRAFSRVESKDAGAVCHGCRNNGSTDMKHPPTPCEFEGGHKDIRFPRGFGPCNENQWRVSDNHVQDQKTREARKLKMFAYLDDADYMENLSKKRFHNPQFITMEMVEEALREY